MALEKKYYSGSQVFDIIKELPDKEFLSMLNTFAKERGADVVEVVRCKDCKYWAETLTKEEREACCIEDDMVCSYWMSDGLTKQDFCSFGEMKENDSVK